MKKKIFQLLFPAIIFTITLWTIFHGENLNEVFAYLGQANTLHITISVFCVLLFIMGESVVIFYLMHTLGTKVKFSHCCLYSFIGFFYSSITPSASGGQPMQIVAMRKDKIPIAVSTIVLAIVTITYKLVLVLLGLFILIVKPGHIMAYLEPVKPIIYLGLFLNVACIAMLLLLVFTPGLVRILATRTLSFINRIHPLRNIEQKFEHMEETLTLYEGTAEFLKSHIAVIVNVFIITLIQRCTLFFITWFTYKSFALSGHSVSLIVGLQAMISVAVDMLPLPGGMAITENMFLEIFNPIFGESLVLPGMIISRGISYYTQFIISAIMTVAASFVITGKNLTSEGVSENQLKGNDKLCL